MNDDRGGHIGVTVEDGLGVVTIDRPHKKNAVTTSMWGAIADAMAELAARADVRLIALQGAGGSFGAGADLEDVLAATASESAARDYAAQVVTALLSVANAPLPTMALVSGVAAGGAAELALACDVRVADASATFAFPFARLGIVPDRFTLDRLASLVGASTARRLVFTGEAVAACRARDIGLVDELTDGPPLAFARQWAESFERGSMRARSAMKGALKGAECAYDVATLVEGMVASFVSGDVRAAALAFLKRGV
jgi:enoyl-CoA hydratase/carnithine racemase